MLFQEPVVIVCGSGTERSICLYIRRWSLGFVLFLDQISLSRVSRQCFVFYLSFISLFLCNISVTSCIYKYIFIDLVGSMKFSRSDFLIYFFAAHVPIDIDPHVNGPTLYQFILKHYFNWYFINGRKYGENSFIYFHTWSFNKTQ